VREVFEETGFDISSRILEENRIEKSRGLQTNSLFVIPDVPESVRAQTVRFFPLTARTEYVKALEGEPSATPQIETGMPSRRSIDRR
jgi:8-oxo-dGTP pyrophosphatase MutT (NUDIX family)